MIGKIPHTLACLLTLIISFGTLGFLLSIVVGSFSEFADNESKKEAEGQPTIKSDLYRMGNEFVDDLEVDGIVIIRPRQCSKRNVTDTKVYSDIRDISTVASANMAYVDSGVDKDQYACKPLDVVTMSTGVTHSLPVRTYNSSSFRCDLDWSKVTNASASKTIEVCNLDVLNMQNVKSMTGPSAAAGLWSALGPMKNAVEGCMNAFIGSNFTSGTYGAYPPTGDVQYDMNPLTYGYGPVGYSRQDVYRGLAGLKNAKFLLSVTASIHDQCQVSNSDDQLTNMCTSWTAFADTTVITGDMLNAPCAAYLSADYTATGTDPATACANSGYCWYNASWVDTSKSEDVTVNARCIPKPAYVTAFSETVVTKGDVCTTSSTSVGNKCQEQQTALHDYYLSVLTSMRMAAPPTKMVLGVRFYNFTETLSQLPENCTKQPLFRDDPDGQKWEDFLESVGAVIAILNDTVLILLLGVYILMERPQEEPEIRIILEVEAMVKNYINLKVMLSLLTGILVAVMLQACGVQLAMVFGLLAFLLNFIPCVGSAIACVLPIPLIVLDDNLSTNEKIIAFCGPASVQLYVGNALEPALFGSSLNLTEISVLNALVLAQLCWGIPGAVLSVPMLGILKIGCHHTEHPMAKYTLSMIRADASVP